MALPSPMPSSFRVIDIRLDSQASEIDITIEGVRSPEAAALNALGIEVVRYGPRRHLVAKVYWQNIGQPLTMVRLYTKLSQSER